jgi:hypothetical protein
MTEDFYDDSEDDWREADARSLRRDPSVTDRQRDPRVRDSQPSVEATIYGEDGEDPRPRG